LALTPPEATVSIHFVGVIGLILIFVIGTLRPINLGRRP
jgi:hypothetical protein